MKFVEKPLGASALSIDELASRYQVDLPIKMVEWWCNSNGPIVFFGYKELQFFSIAEIMGEDIYDLKKQMQNAMPLCMDGSGNICVVKINERRVSGFYVVSCSDLGWEESKLIAETFPEFLNDTCSPEERLNA